MSPEFKIKPSNTSSRLVLKTTIQHVFKQHLCSLGKASYIHWNLFAGYSCPNIYVSFYAKMTSFLRGDNEEKSCLMLMSHPYCIFFTEICVAGLKINRLLSNIPHCHRMSQNVPWASCQISELAGCACAGNAGVGGPAVPQVQTGTSLLVLGPQVSRPPLDLGPEVTRQDQKWPI